MYSKYANFLFYDYSPDYGSLLLNRIANECAEKNLSISAEFLKYLVTKPSDMIYFELFYKYVEEQIESEKIDDITTVDLTPFLTKAALGKKWDLICVYLGYNPCTHYRTPSPDFFFKHLTYDTSTVNDVFWLAVKEKQYNSAIKIYYHQHEKIDLTDWTDSKDVSSDDLLHCFLDNYGYESVLSELIENNHWGLFNTIILNEPCVLNKLSSIGDLLSRTIIKYIHALVIYDPIMLILSVLDNPNEHINTIEDESIKDRLKYKMTKYYNIEFPNLFITAITHGHSNLIEKYLEKPQAVIILLKKIREEFCKNSKKHDYTALNTLAKFLFYLLDKPNIFKNAFDLIDQNMRQRTLSAFIEAENESDSLKLEHHMIKSGDATLIRLVESHNPSYFMYSPKSNTYLAKVSARHFNPEAMRLFQKLQHSSAALTITKLVERHLGISFSNNNKLTSNYKPTKHTTNKDVMLGYEMLRKAAQSNPLFIMKHLVYTKGDFSRILLDGKISSKMRIEQIRKSRGITCENDIPYRSELYSYFYLSTMDKISSILLDEDNKFSHDYITFDYQILCSTQPSLTTDMILKSFDWGFKRRGSRIKCLCPGINLLCINSYQTKKDNDQILDIHESTLTYQLIDSNNKHLSDPYKISYAEELICLKENNIGVSIYQWIIRHMDNWPMNHVKTVLNYLTELKNEKTEQNAAAYFFTQFFDFEASIPGALPLQLTYVNEICFSGCKPISFSEFKSDLINGNLPKIQYFFKENPNIMNVPFIIFGAIRLASTCNDKAKVKNILEYLYKIKTHNSSNVVRVSEEIWQCEQLLKLIYENYNDHTTIDPYSDKELLLKTNVHNESNIGATHYAALPQVRVALGNIKLINTSSLDNTILPSDFLLVLDGNDYNENDENGHGPLNNIIDVRDKLLAHELATLLTSAQNNRYFITNNGNFHPRTGKGATQSKIVTRLDRLDDCSIHAKIDNNNYVVITVENKNDDKTPQLKKDIQDALSLKNSQIDHEDNEIHVKVPLNELISLMRKTRINYNGLIVLDTDGNLLLAYRINQGLASAGGHHNNPYHPNPSHELKDEFGLVCANPENVNQQMRLIARVGDYKDTGIFIISTDDCRPTDYTREYANKYNLKAFFKAEEDEFLKNSEVVLALHELRGKKMRNVMPLKIIVEYQKKQLVEELEKLSFYDNDNFKVSVNSDFNFNSDSSYQFKIPTNEFGKIIIKANENQSLDELSEILNKCLDIHDNINVSENQIIIDGINPISLAKTISQLCPEKLISYS